MIPSKTTGQRRFYLPLCLVSYGVDKPKSPRSRYQSTPPRRQVQDTGVQLPKVWYFKVRLPWSLNAESYRYLPTCLILPTAPSSVLPIALPIFEAPFFPAGVPQGRRDSRDSREGASRPRSPSSQAGPARPCACQVALAAAAALLAIALLHCTTRAANPPTEPGNGDGDDVCVSSPRFFFSFSCVSRLVSLTTLYGLLCSLPSAAQHQQTQPFASMIAL